ncbi:hypothetical protein SPRG_22289 [Saprolegnia parasitica CBS 223.65]|uniref:Uncharacterized protein n=1 Tax=Saprolegnia parasitica (strain CBS 223.65) TaxID=695850 RepID=A0A067C1R5_SAPPC|nr:hypothetical protein SPRG_22289 [Saprolegnia parasitica CBS 223.65]KDO23075.1 hypothetical protein SPRG_22289 [Saprolegnia parasitica CBS 223.65]|eukprot:XP_012206247.1 hypothetical protein SPRG_22289 [Saprolegnia parasitica CBS 223.65]
MLAITNGQASVIQSLINRSIPDVLYPDGKTVLMMAISCGLVDVAAQLLQKSRNVNAVDRDGKTALMIASAKGYEKVVQHFMNRSNRDLDPAALDLVDPDGNTALILAIQNGHDAVAQYLIAQGANINLTDKDDKTALMKASMAGDTGMVTSILKFDKSVDVRLGDKATRMTRLPYSSTRDFRTGRQR